MFLELGAAVKDGVLENVPREGPIGLLTDEATDLSVTSQVITFVQFFNKAMGKTDTAFLGIQDILEEHDAPDAMTIKEKLEHLLQENNLNVESVAAMATDGAKLMTGRNEGVVAKLRRKKTNKNLIGVHCICHNLQLACNDSNDEKYISNVLQTLRQLWYFMENSPKRTKAERSASSMKHIKSRLRSCLKSDLLNALMQVAVNGPPVLESLPVVEIAVKNWLGRKNRRKKKKNATASSNPMATVSEPVVTEPITVDAACQTTFPGIEEEVQEVASALDLCVENDDFDTDSDSAIESGEEDSYIDF